MEDFGKQMKDCSVISASGISSLLEGIEKSEQSTKSANLKILKDRCCDKNVGVACAAFHGIRRLVEKKILVGSQTVSSLISVLPSLSHYSPLVVTVGDILLLEIQDQVKTNGKHDVIYNFTDRPHPFVTILKHDASKSWDAVYGYIHYLLIKCPEIQYSYKINSLQTVFFYIFCNPIVHSVSYKNELFNLLLEQCNKPKIIHLIMQGIAWQHMDINFCWLLHKILHCLINSALHDIQLIISALTPILTLAIKWILINGHNPSLWIDLLFSCINISADGANAALYIISDAILLTPTLFIGEVIDVCKYIVCSRMCNKYVAHKFASVILIWLINPSTLADSVFKNLEYIIKFLMNNSQWNKISCNLGNNPYYSILKNSHNEVRMAVEMTNLSNEWNENETLLFKWLNNIFSSEHIILQKSLLPFISGIVLCESSDKILDIACGILSKMSSSVNDVSLFQLSIVFFKLSRENNPKRQMKYLQLLIEMANAKENVPLIIGIIETLKNANSQTMTSVVIYIYLKLWKVDSRTYPYLHKSLFTNSGEKGNSWEVNVIKTVALREICRLSPEIYGKSLVPKLSEILNECNNYESGIPSAIAIEAVIELCKAQVTDILGTWRALRPKLSQDKRAEVIVSLCKLFGEIPNLKSTGAERDSLINDVMPRLWNYALSSNLRVIKAALSSLAKFNPETYSPKLLPVTMKESISIPKQYQKASAELSKTEIFDSLEFIPGECWIELLKRVKPEAVEDAGGMLIELLEDEIILLPRRYFYHPEEAPEPTSYSNLPHSSICRALVDHIKSYLNTPVAKNKKNVPMTILQCLRILSSNFSKNFPPLDWSFMENFISHEKCEKMAATILVKQASASKAGRKAFEKFITENLAKFEKGADFLFLYSALPNVCNALGANVLRQFLEKTIKFSCKSSVNLHTDHFDTVLTNVRLALDNKSVPEPRKALLVSQMQNILNSIPPEHEIMSKYANFAIILPSKTIECISSPALWPEVTSTTLQRSVLIRRSIALQTETNNPLVLFNECIDAVCSMPSEQSFVSDKIIEVIRKKRYVYHGNWIEELMWRTQVSTSSSTSSQSIKVTLFLLDLFINCVITLTGYDCFLSERDDEMDKKISMLNFFPSALYELLRLQEWNPVCPKVIEWIHSLTRWKNLPRVYVENLEQAILIMRNNEYFAGKNKWLNLFYLPTINYVK